MSRRPATGGVAAGWTLVELMAGLALTLIVAAAGAAMAYAVHAAYAMAADDIRLEQRGQQALDVVASLLRHAGWHPASPAPWLPLSASDDCGEPAASDPPACGRHGIAGSDALLVRFGGNDAAGTARDSDRHVTDCSGYPLVPRAEIYANAGGPRTRGYLATNLLYVGNASDGDPQLLCRYVGHGGGWSSSALARGVETFQLRYGVGSDNDSRIERFLRASELSAQGVNGWRKVRAVQVVLVLRGDQSRVAVARSVPLLPPRSKGDDGDDIAFTPASRPTALRRAFATTVWLRNAPFCREAPC